jgi:Zn-dependent M28 family amino/carboxypeptidase
MNRSAIAAVFGIIGLALTSVPADMSAQGTHHFQDEIAAMAAGADSAARGSAITEYLRRNNIDVHAEDFSFPQFTGTNIVATLPGRNTTKTLLLGAHYDRTPKGRGALDNATSCAVVEQLLSDLKADPLDNYAVRAVFFDLEERGLVGSQAYFFRHQGETQPAKAINLDLFGYGDTLFVDASSLASSMLTSLQDAAKGGPIHVRAIASMTDYPASDNRIMMDAGIETLGIALVGQADVDAVLAHGAAVPPIATIIHTDADTIDKIRPQDMERAFPVIEKAIRLMDTQP